MIDSASESTMNDSSNSTTPAGPNRRGRLRFVPASVLYVAAGVFALALTSCDSGSTGTAPNQPPNATFTANSEADNALMFNFDASGSADTNTQGSIESYEWDMGDGSSASGKTVTHEYSDVGVYEVTLTTVDEEGAEDTYTETVAASAPPEVSFTATPAEIDPTDYTFDASSSEDPDGEIEKFSWNFGDGEAGSGEVVTHNYDVTEDKSVVVTLTATDGIGTSNSTTKTIDIDVPVFVNYPKTNWEVADFSSQMPGRSDKAAVLAIDGDPSTHWHTPWCCAADEYGTSRPQPPHTITIDMQETKRVYGLEVIGRDGNYFNNPKEVTVKFADEYNGEDTNWRNAQAFTLPLDDDGDAVEAEVFLEGIAEARYFKFIVREPVDNDITNVAELSAITTQEELQGE
jgi:PKD repeat protein